jgi:hypothetical protein
MNFLESKLAQLVALGTLLATIAGVGYAGAGYVQRLEALESQSAVSYEEDINSLKAEMLVINEKLGKLELLGKIEESVNQNNKDWAILKEQYMNSKNDLEKQIENLEKKLEKDKNPLAS